MPMDETEKQIVELTGAARRALVDTALAMRPVAQPILAVVASLMAGAQAARGLNVSLKAFLELAEAAYSDVGKQPDLLAALKPQDPRTS